MYPTLLVLIPPNSLRFSTRIRTRKLSEVLVCSLGDGHPSRLSPGSLHGCNRPPAALFRYIHFCRGERLHRDIRVGTADDTVHPTSCIQRTIHCDSSRTMTAVAEVRQALPLSGRRIEGLHRHPKSDGAFNGAQKRGMCHLHQVEALFAIKAPDHINQPVHLCTGSILDNTTSREVG